MTIRRWLAHWLWPEIRREMLVAKQKETAFRAIWNTEHRGK